MAKTYSGVGFFTFWRASRVLPERKISGAHLAVYLIFLLCVMLIFGQTEEAGGEDGIRVTVDGSLVFAICAIAIGRAMVHKPSPVSLLPCTAKRRTAYVYGMALLSGVVACVLALAFIAALIVVISVLVDIAAGDPIFTSLELDSSAEPFDAGWAAFGLLRGCALFCASVFLSYLRNTRQMLIAGAVCLAVFEGGALALVNGMGRGSGFLWRADLSQAFSAHPYAWAALLAAGVLAAAAAVISVWYVYRREKPGSF